MNDGGGSGLWLPIRNRVRLPSCSVPASCFRNFRETRAAPIRRDPHEDLGDGQGDDLGVGLTPTGVRSPLWQKIIGCAINDGAEGVQVGLYRGLRADGVLDTVGLAPLPRIASSPPCSWHQSSSLISCFAAAVALSAESLLGGLATMARPMSSDWS